MAEIRDGRLYKPKFKTFDEYLRKKWNIKRAHGYRLIDAAVIAKEMSPVGDIASERVAREFTKVPKDQRKEIFKSALAKAKCEGRKLTAKDIYEMVNPTTKVLAVSSNTSDLSDEDQEPTPKVAKPKTAYVMRIPASAIATLPNLMQFKRMDNLVTGENEAEKLTGVWDDYKAGNLLLWEPLNPTKFELAPGKTYIVANGHHRFAFGHSQKR